MSDPRLQPSEVHDLIAAALVRSRTSEANAAAVARALVAAELAGQTGHGLRRVAAYSAQAASGKVDGFAQPVVQMTRPGAVSIDAAHGFDVPSLGVVLLKLGEPAKR